MSSLPSIVTQPARRPSLKGAGRYSLEDFQRTWAMNALQNILANLARSTNAMLLKMPTLARHEVSVSSYFRMMKATRLFLELSSTLLMVKTYTSSLLRQGQRKKLASSNNLRCPLIKIPKRALLRRKVSASTNKTSLKGVIMTNRLTEQLAQAEFQLKWMYIHLRLLTISSFQVTITIITLKADRKPSFSNNQSLISLWLVTASQTGCLLPDRSRWFQWIWTTSILTQRRPILTLRLSESLICMVTLWAGANYEPIKFSIKDLILEECLTPGLFITKEM